MLENTLKDYLVSKVTNLTAQNCFVGEFPQNPAGQTNALIVSANSPLSDSHNSLAERLHTPKGIGETSVAIVIITKSDVYDNASNLIWGIYDALGSDDGGCITQSSKQMYIVPNEAPYCEGENTFKLNFIVRTNKN